MQFGPWATALIASVAGGAAVCAALVVRRRWIPLCFAVGTLAAVTDTLACALIWGAAHRFDGLIAAVALSMGAAAGGFALYASILGSRPERRGPVFDGAVAPASPGTHVILLADAEPESYDPAAVTAGLGRFGANDLDLPPEVARPLIYASERSRYHRIGTSPARGAVRGIAATLESRLAGLEDATAITVSAAFCTGGPSLAQEVSRSVAGGCRRLVVAPLSAAWSPAFEQALQEVPTPALAAAGVAVETAVPLWASEHLSTMIAQRIVSELGGDRSSDGVVLISEGDPWEQERSQQEYREQMTFLIERVRSELVRAGVAAGRIKRAWLWLEEPDIAEAVRHATAVGARTLVIVPVTYPTETLATLIDVRYAAERAAADTGAAVTVIGAWGDDPAVVESLTDAVRDAVGRFV